MVESVSNEVSIFEIKIFFYKIAEFLFHLGVGKGVAKGLRKLKGRFRPKFNFAYVEGDRESRI